MPPAAPRRPLLLVPGIGTTLSLRFDSMRAPAARLEENVAAVDIELDDEDLEKIEQIAPRGAAAGKRYDPAALGLTNR
jgi:hypothetical protein